MKLIRLHNGMAAQVDDDLFDKLNKWKWYAHQSKKGGTWYAISYSYKKNGKKKFVYMHRKILGLRVRSKQADHIDKNGLNNQRINLRKCTNAQNQMAKGKCNRPTTSKFLGVSKHGNGWRAYIKKNQKTLRLGTFRSEKDAAVMYNVASQLFFREFAYINKI